MTFHRFVVRAQRHCEYLLSHIISMDETPMRFEVPATRTLEFTGNRTVPIIPCSADKQSFTVALAVKANGEKLPLQMQVSVRKKGWMDEEGIIMLLYSYISRFVMTHMCIL